MERRASGLLLHPSSLPGPSGIGDLGPAAHRFVDFLADAGQAWWQMLPVGPIGAAHSPYQSPSSFAGNPLLVSLEGLAEEGLLEAGEVRLALGESEDRVGYPTVVAFKEARLRRAFGRLARGPAALVRAFEGFLGNLPAWLPDFLLFAAVREARGGQAWWRWPAPLRDREASALEDVRSGGLAESIRYHAFVQFMFERQWHALARHCHERGVSLLGDLPIYVAHESAEVWAHRELFDLLPDGTARAVAGVPPDYFSADGQLWGNPLYRWDEHARQAYAWWVERLGTTLARFDVVRLDHFIGFVNYWSVPRESETAKGGHWEPGPAAGFFERVREALGGLPFLAEDLGEVTPPVHELRERLGLPGMRVLQFSFTSDTDGPEHFPERSAAYTGTHDNDTLLGWLRELPERCEPAALVAWMLERERALARIGGDGPDAHWKLLRLVFEAPSRLAMAPLQDVLGLGRRARLNRPGTTARNWEWRITESQLLPQIGERLLALTRDSGRSASTALRPALR
jgi:4-alpha-glucanotransferase